jgi:3-deoxy-D-manno-octulosonate 8-phosphate phosphatase (KDO 8-P phosphatase)
MSSFLDNLVNVKGFIFDLDGVITSSQMPVLQDGRYLRQINVKDMFALMHAKNLRYNIAVVSGSDDEGIFTRLQALGIEDLYFGVENRMGIMESFMLRRGIPIDEIIYMGDDIPDLPAMDYAQIAVCPADACQEIKEAADYITLANGGQGAVREIIEMVLKTKGNWDFKKKIEE